MKDKKVLKQKQFKSYTYFGSHRKDSHFHFRVWAPHAQAVSLVGDFNQWDLAANPMIRLDGGIWEATADGLEPGSLYKYALTQTDGTLSYKADPYGFYSEIKPKTASAFWPLDDYAWQDDQYCTNRLTQDPMTLPMTIYELHLGSWKRHRPDDYLSYRELAETLIPYLVEMSYTHIELMGIMEHPFDGSLGCEVSGYYAATSRYGTPSDFMYLIDSCHQKGIGVILDWSPSHFCQDAHSLYRFDGQAQYEVTDHPQWQTAFDYDKMKVRDFLISNAYFWFDIYHIDGLRVGNVAAMLGADCDQTPERPGALTFLQDLNAIIFKDFPFAIMAAADTSMTTPVDQLGFNLKWDQGWTADTLGYLGIDPNFRHQFHHLLTRSMPDSLADTVILPLGHDAVSPDKKSILSQLFGDYDQKFDQFRLLYAYQMTHPGKKLSFMGNEFAPFSEWQVDEALEWFMLEFDKHRESHHYIKELNKFYQRERALWADDQGGFAWLTADNHEEGILIFSRTTDNPDDHLIVVINFLAMDYLEYPIGVPLAGRYRLAFNSDLLEYGGRASKVKKTMQTRNESHHDHDQSIRVTIPPSAMVIFKRVKPRKRSK